MFKYGCLKIISSKRQRQKGVKKLIFGKKNIEIENVQYLKFPADFRFGCDPTENPDSDPQHCFGAYSAVWARDC